MHEYTSGIIQESYFLHTSSPEARYSFIIVPRSRYNIQSLVGALRVNKAVDKGDWKCRSYPEKSDTECYKSDVVLLEKVPGGTDSVGAGIVLLERDAGDGHNRAQYEVE